RHGDGGEVDAPAGVGARVRDREPVVGEGIQADARVEEVAGARGEVAGAGTVAVAERAAAARRPGEIALLAVVDGPVPARRSERRAAAVHVAVVLAVGRLPRALGIDHGLDRVGLPVPRTARDLVEGLHEPGVRPVETPARSAVDPDPLAGRPRVAAELPEGRPARRPEPYGLALAGRRSAGTIRKRCAYLVATVVGEAHAVGLHARARACGAERGREPRPGPRVARGLERRIATAGDLRLTPEETGLAVRDGSELRARTLVGGRRARREQQAGGDGRNHGESAGHGPGHALALRSCDPAGQS